MNKAVVIGSHNDKVPFKKNMGVCIFCDGIVYLAGFGLAGEASIEEIGKMIEPKFIGMECVFDLVTRVSDMMRPPQEEKEKMKDELLKKEAGLHKDLN